MCLDGRWNNECFPHYCKENKQRDAPSIVKRCRICKILKCDEETETTCLSNHSIPHSHTPTYHLTRRVNQCCTKTNAGTLLPRALRERITPSCNDHPPCMMGVRTVPLTALMHWVMRGMLACGGWDYLQRDLLGGWSGWSDGGPEGGGQSCYSGWWSYTHPGTSVHPGTQCPLSIFQSYQVSNIWAAMWSPQLTLTLNNTLHSSPPSPYAQAFLQGHHLLAHSYLLHHQCYHPCCCSVLCFLCCDCFLGVLAGLQKGEGGWVYSPLSWCDR